MPILKIVLIWLAVAAAFLGFALALRKKLDALALITAAVGSTVVTAASLLLPKSGAPLDFCQVALRWARNAVSFTVLMHFIRQPSRKKSAISGLAFATTLTILEFLA